jgi:hypothetical protein
MSKIPEREGIYLSVYLNGGDVVVKFPKDTNHLVLSPEQADRFSHSLRLKAEEVRANQAEQEGKLH